jgi:hypothetical protein
MPSVAPTRGKAIASKLNVIVHLHLTTGTRQPGIVAQLATHQEFAKCRVNIHTRELAA